MGVGIGGAGLGAALILIFPRGVVLGASDVPAGNLDCDLLSSVTQDCDSLPG